MPYTKGEIPQFYCSVCKTVFNVEHYFQAMGKIGAHNYENHIGRRGQVLTRTIQGSIDYRHVKDGRMPGKNFPI